MDANFKILLLKDARKFLKSLDKRASTKIIGNIRKSQSVIDSTLFKKLTTNIWEFRTQYEGMSYRLLAFWDRTENQNVLVVATHGFIKKQNKVSEQEIVKALNIRKAYFLAKKSNDL